MSRKSLDARQEIGVELPPQSTRFLEIHRKWLAAQGAKPTTVPKLRPRSGLEMLSATHLPQVAESDQERLLRLKLHILATPETWRRWKGIKELPAGVALALHHYLDPDAMGMTDPTGIVYSDLNRNYYGLPDSPIPWFDMDLLNLSAYLLAGRLPCVKVEMPPMQSTVLLDEFCAFMRGDAAYDFFPSQLSSPNGEAVQAPITWHLSASTQAVLGASALYRTVAEGGSYVPGVHSTSPDVDSYLKSEHGIESKSLRQAICTIVRPADLPKGRPPKHGDLRRHKSPTIPGAG